MEAFNKIKELILLKEVRVYYLLFLNIKIKININNKIIINILS